VREAMYHLLDNVLAVYYLQTTKDGKPLEKSFEELKKEVEKYKMIIITSRGGEYAIYLGKYVEEKGLGGILKQAINLGRIYDITQQRYKDYDFIGFVIYGGKYLDRLIEESNKKYGLEDRIIGFTIVVGY
jgi:glycosyltransferase involved in cell wall biosynthesis